MAAAMAQNQHKDSCVVQHAALISETVKSHKLLRPDSKLVMCCQQVTPVLKQKSPVVWGIRKYR